MEAINEDLERDLLKNPTILRQILESFRGRTATVAGYS